MRIGTAGWTIPVPFAHVFPGAGTHLQRYAGQFDAVEINSSFYRPHRPATYARWTASVPDGFRFAVKIPKAITHERRLVDCADLIERFAGEIEGLGPKLGPLLIQLPPSLAFDATMAARFFAGLRGRIQGDVACEPRHASWFSAEADALLIDCRVARVAADPAPVPDAGVPGGWPGLVYWRLHGSPRVYYSDYDAGALAVIGRRLEQGQSLGAPVWCIFDNTALGHALGNAVAVDGSTRSALCKD